MTNAFWRQCLVPTIQKKLLLVMLAVALTPMAIFGVIAFHRVSEAFITQVGEKLVYSSQQSLNQIDRTFSFSRENVISWSQLDVMQRVAEGDPEGQISLLLEDYQNAYGVFSTLVVADASGNVVAAGDRDLLGVSVASADWFQHAYTNKTPVMGSLRLDPLLGGYGIKIVVPILKRFGKGEVLGVIAASFDWSELLHMVNAIDVARQGQNPHAYALLIDSDGYIIAAPDFILAEDDGSSSEVDRLRVFGKRWWAADNPQMLQQFLDAPGHRYVHRNDREMLVVNMPTKGFSALNEMGWSLLLVRDADEALEGLAFVRSRALWVGAFATLAILLVAWAFSRHISAPIQRLSEWAGRLTSGQLDSRLDLDSPDEIGDLARALEGMRRHMKHSIDEISDAKDRYESVLDSIDCIVWEVEINPVRVVLVSGKVEPMMGFAPEEIGQRISTWREWIHADYHDAVASAFSRAVANAEDIYLEFKARHAKGHWVWLKACISVVIEGIRVVGLRGVMVDISDIFKASEEMQKAHDLAVRTAENKSRFLAIVSHEIRTPMNGLLGMLELMRDSGGVREDQKDTLQLAWQSGRNLLSLVDDVMDFTRLEAGEMDFRYERVSIHELLSLSLSLIAPDAYKRGLDVGLVLEANLPAMLVCDPVKVRQVLTNLLSNAVKFTQHGSVLLWAELLPGNRLFVEVKDTGVGIDSEEQRNLFQAFVLGDSSTTRKHGGSGLGLALSQRMLESMGGKIGCRSIKGLGSSFFFELPVEVVPDQISQLTTQREQFGNLHGGAAVLLIGDLPATQMVMQLATQQWGLDFHWEPKETRVVRNMEEILDARDYHWIFIAQEMSERFWEKLAPYMQSRPHMRIIQLRLPTEKAGQRPLPHLYVPFSGAALAEIMLGRRELVEQGSTRSAAAPATSPLLLVVDDNEVNRKVVCGFLRKMGYEVDTAENGQEAVDAVLAKPYALVFMDCQMPVMDGYEATREIKTLTRSRHLPVVAITANAMEGDRDKCLAAGMDDYMTKPVRREKLQEMLDRWLEQALQSQA